MRLLLALVWGWLLTKLQDRCGHESRYVTADLAEGGMLPTQIPWCRLCGAYRHGDYWSMPRPLWWLR